jgi:hypothetical protein
MNEHLLDRVRDKNRETEGIYRQYRAEVEAELLRIDMVIAALTGQDGPVSRVDEGYTVIRDIKRLLEQETEPMLEDAIIRKIEPIAKSRHISDPKAQIHRSLYYHSKPERDLVCVAMRGGKWIEVAFKKGSSRNPEDNLIMLRSKYLEQR